MGFRKVTSNLTGGVIAEALHSRVDIAKYEASCAVADNMVVSPYGGMRKRPGLNVGNGARLSTTNTRIEKFNTGVNDQYILAFSRNLLSIYQDGTTLVDTVALSNIDDDNLYEFDIAQYLDTVIIVHNDFHPIVIQKFASTDWQVVSKDWYFPLHAFDGAARPDYTWTNTGDPVEVTIKPNEIVWNVDGNDVNGADGYFYKNIRTSNATVRLDEEDYTDVSKYELVVWGEPVFSATRGYPTTLCFYQQRLWFGGAKSLETAVFGSKINGYFDFRLGLGEDDFGIFDIIETGDYNRIVNIVGGRTLQVFTSQVEFINGVSSPTPADSAWIPQTGYGSKRVTPILLDGSAFFLDQSGRSLRSFVYSYEEDSNVSPSVSLLASHLMTGAKAMDVGKGMFDDVSDFIFVVQDDGTCAVWNTNRLENISGWTRWTTNGTFLDVKVIDQKVFFLVKRAGDTYIELLDDDCYSDHAIIEYGADPVTEDVYYFSSAVTYGGVQVTYITNPDATKISALTDTFDGLAQNLEFSVSLDYNISDSVTPADGQPIQLPREAARVEVGLPYTATIETLPINISSNAGNNINKKKRFGSVHIDVVDTIGGKVKQTYIPSRQYDISKADGSPTFFTGIKEFRFLGYQKRLSLTVTQEDILPLYIRSIDMEIEY